MDEEPIQIGKQAEMEAQIDELERITRQAILRGQEVGVPYYVATCPECEGRLIAQNNQWEAATGIPDRAGLDLECSGQDDQWHRYWQSEWQSVCDAVADFFEAK